MGRVKTDYYHMTGGITIHWPAILGSVCVPGFWLITKSCEKNTLRRAIPTVTNYFVIVTDITSGSIQRIYVRHSFLVFYLTSYSDILFGHSTWHIIWHYSDILFGIYSDISSAFYLASFLKSSIYSDISLAFFRKLYLTFFLAFYLTFYSRILSSIYSAILFCDSIWHSFWHSFWHLCGHSFWHRRGNLKLYILMQSFRLLVVEEILNQDYPCWYGKSFVKKSDGPCVARMEVTKDSEALAGLSPSPPSLKHYIAAHRISKREWNVINECKRWYFQQVPSTSLRGVLTKRWKRSIIKPKNYALRTP